MIKDNQKYFNRLHVLLDALAVAGSYLLAWYLKMAGPFAEEGVGTLPMNIYFSALYFLVPGYIILYYWYKLYTPKRSQTLEREIIDIFKANLTGVAGFMICLTAFKITDFSRGLIGIFFVLNMTFTLTFRIVLRKVLRYFRKKGYNLKYILLVGYSRAAEEYINRINANPQWGYVVRGILDNHVPTGTMYRGVKVLGSIENLEVILPLSQLDEIAVTLSLADYDILEEIVSLCEKSGVHTKFIPDYNSLIPNKPYTEDLMGLPVINIRYVPLTNTLNAAVKRLMDIVGSALGLVILSPLLFILAILVRISSKGPVIFKQERVGLHNKPFQMYKFRSMEVQTEDREKEGWTVKNDPRVTRIGKVMRKTSMDELPQLWNILKGDMSIVGPRPERPQFVERFREEIPRYMIKHQVRPGLTGWAQVNGYRGDTSIRRRIECDLYYIENWSMAFDIKIIFMTLFKGLVNENAY
ncbi:MAG: undecaprenyl-phosphate glucose phosphotransferase [Lachnospiraceae bacterium]|nr:undecaprenyl-phosphate glucose phosphotransferase [Lachnospiraceae bacterium]MDD7049858.1 undecaprenyl-phosphate glucose phosphotransferase [Lachnospiraceae bacterium]MDY3222587.1 undecaprenyl-phosphate glucose phosphotransferase [Lachnospiraceae bacterium]MDY4096420.1 undecaprenyl-phosphate glucose phosphotransferase [Lachnospiraceae bacterium]